MEAIPLWTWQNKNLNLADKDQMINSHEHSPYNHREAYENVFQKYSDQIIWCWNDFESSICPSTILEYKGQDRLLWELNVPKNNVFWYCPVAWQKLRTGRLEMPVGAIGEVINSLRASEISQKLKSDFESFWSDKNEDELLDLVFLKRCVSLRLSDMRMLVCSGSIVRHPVPLYGGRITKNPLEIGEWWPIRNQIYRPIRNISPDDADYLVKMKPCLNCSGRS